MSTERSDKGKGSEAIGGRNAVFEALRSGRQIERIIVASGTVGSVKQIVAMAKESNVKVEYRDRDFLDEKFDGRHQGVIAYVAAHRYSSVNDILEHAHRQGQPPLIMILDDVEDPHNLGAIMRTAECAGVHGVIIGKNRSAGLNDTVAKSSAGAIEYMKVARVTNIARTIDDLKTQGVWIAACDMDGQRYTDADLTGAIALVVGNEGKGISRLVKDKCDFTVSIPMFGHISSLNVSNAAALIMYEVIRQREEQ